MEIIFEIIFQFIAELVLQIIGEAVAELLGHRLKETFRRTRPVHPWLAAIGYLVFGAIAGGISLLLFPNLFIRSTWLRYANLIFTPTLAGLVMALVGSWRRKHDREIIRLDSFSYGFCFALTMALVRFIFGH